jgi:hypothetical protein
MLNANNYPATSLCDALNNGPLTNRIRYDDVIASLWRIDAVYPGSPLTDWNNRVGAKMTPPTTWEKIILASFPEASRQLDRGLLGPNSAMDYAECEPCPERVSLTATPITIGADGHPVISGVVLK